MRLVLVLTLVCIVSALTLGITSGLTSARIAIQEQIAEKEAVSLVLPDAVKLSDEIAGAELEYYKGYDVSGNLIGYAFVNSGQGYSSTIKVMIGINPLLKLKGIKILSQNETPGLGDKVNEIQVKGTLWDLIMGRKIEKPSQPWFQAQFSDKSSDTLDNIQFITGATITSKAVVNIVRDGIEKFKNMEGK